MPRTTARAAITRPTGAEIPQSYFDFHKFAITGEASELRAGGFDFLYRLPRGDTGFWMITPRSQILFILKKTETEDGKPTCWRFSSAGWTPTGKPVAVTVYNE